ncbi:hypothetical protein EON66_12330 [archaeon]|nr:MAG: hypothetical protein EON66_12330 [archaeon]
MVPVMIARRVHAAQLLVATVWQSVLEYYYHRLMHLPAVYRHLHKYHHANTAPEPFDDMLIHPFEGACVRVRASACVCTSCACALHVRREHSQWV